MTEKELHDKVLGRQGHPDGTRVPEGYFDNFVLDMASRLPVNDLEQSTRPRTITLTRWQRIRPYVYMAAMFAGIWCMMKMFSIMRGSTIDLSFDNNPSITAALSNDDFVNNFILPAYSEDEILDDMYCDGVSPWEISNE